MNNLFTLQAESLEYSPTEPDYIKLLEADIEETLLENIRQWRKRFPPRWNRLVVNHMCWTKYYFRNCSKILRTLLEKCEPDKMGLQKVTDEEHERELLKLRVSYNLHGFPFNMPYTDVQQIVDTVFQTNIHKTEDPKAEFAIATLVVPYANKILSVWIYVAVLVPK
jgi:coiled-coil and C2 domain-containing protein 2A